MWGPNTQWSALAVYSARNGSGHAAAKRDECAALHLRGHSITSSVRASSIAHGDRAQLYSQRGRRRLDGTQLTGTARYGHIPKDGRARQLRDARWESLASAIGNRAIGTARELRLVSRSRRADIVEVQGRSNQSQVRKRLRKITDLSLRMRIIFFREQADVVAKR